MPDRTIAPVKRHPQLINRSIDVRSFAHREPGVEANAGDYIVQLLADITDLSSSLSSDARGFPDDDSVSFRD